MPWIELRDMIAVLALVLGIVNLAFAPRYLKFLEKKKEAHSRRVSIFKKLMTTRASTLSYQHVEALNTIDLEFHEPKFHTIVTARDNYYEALFERFDDPSFAGASVLKRADLLIILLSEMAKLLDYGHSVVQIRRSIYNPQAHVDAEEDDLTIRKGLAALLKDNAGWLPIHFQQDDDAAALAAQKQSEMYDLIIKYYKKKLNKF